MHIMAKSIITENYENIMGSAARHCFFLDCAKMSYLKKNNYYYFECILKNWEV